MLFKREILERIATGDVTLAFRRWKRPTVKAGGRLRTRVGVLAIDRVDLIEAASITDAEARAAGHTGRAQLLDALQGRDDDGLYRIAFRVAGDDPRIALRQADDLSEDERAAIRARLASIDLRANTPWTWRVLQCIGDVEGLPAAEIARRLSLEKPVLKRRVRQLKELGLTESLAVGYRLSLRGRAFIAATPDLRSRS